MMRYHFVESARGEMFVEQQVFAVQNGARGYAGGLQLGHQLLVVVGAGLKGQHLVQLGAAFDAA